MEFTNEIFFNKPLTANTTVIITYCGKLYREHSKDVSIVYGYGQNWDYTDSSTMIETENGFEVTIALKDYDTFNFCFTNSFNIWDNNFGFNYIAPISSNTIITDRNTDSDNFNADSTTIDSYSNTSETDSNTIASSYDTSETDSNTIDSSSDISETDSNTIASYSDTAETNSNTVDSYSDTANTDSNNVDIISNTNNKYYNVNIQEINNPNDIDKTFSSLLDSLINYNIEKDENIDISNLSGFGLQSVDNIKEEEMINCDEIFDNLFKELTTNTSLETDTYNQKIEKNNYNLNYTTNLYNDYSDNSERNSNIESKITEYENYDIQELDSLMDNLLDAITNNSDNNNISATPIQKIEQNNYDKETTSLTIINQNEDWIDKIINFSFNFTKKISNACKKLGNIIKIKTKKFGFNNNK